MSKLDLSKFKKVASTANATTLKHPAGHTITIAHSAVSPEMKGQLDKLSHFNEGGGAGWNYGKAYDKKPVQQGASQAQSDYANSLNQKHLAEDKAKNPQPKQAPTQEPQSEVGQSFPATECEGGRIGYSSGGEADADSFAKKRPQAEPSPKPFGSNGDPDNPVAKGVAATFQNMDEGGPVDELKQLAPLAMLALSDGGKVTDQQGKTVGQLIGYPGSEPAPKQPPAQNYAKGGKTGFHTMTPPNYAKNIPHFAEGTPDTTIGDPLNPPPSVLPDTSGDPTAGMPSVSPTVDPQQAAYEQAYTQMKGSNPKAKALSQLSGDFDPKVGREAIASVDAAKQEQNQSQGADYKQAQMDNQTRAAFGMDPNPLPQAPANGSMPAPAAAPQDQQQQAPASNPSADADYAAWQAGQTPPSLQQQQQRANQANHMTYQAIGAERQKFIQALQDPVKAKTIKDIFEGGLNNKDGGNSIWAKLGMIGGVLLGGGADAALGRQNGVMQMYQSAIDNDLKAQQLNLGRKETLLSNNMQMFNNLPQAIQMTKLNMMDTALKQLTDMAAKYPNDPRIQQQMQAAALMHAQSSKDLQTNLAITHAWSQYADHISDPAHKIQMNPMLQPDQKSQALKDLGTAQNMNAARSNIMDAFSKVEQMPLAGAMSPNQRDALIEPGLAQIVKDSEGRITPQDTAMIRALMPAKTDMGSTRAVKRAQLYKFMSSKMNFPSLTLAGVDSDAANPSSNVPGPVRATPGAGGQTVQGK